MQPSIDLSRYIQRRHFRSYERDMARSTYGYGVDLRRTRWLTGSLLGQAPLRALEHAWFNLADALMAEELRVPDRPSDIPILSEIVKLAKRLRTTPPAIRLLREGARDRGEWGPVTPLGDPRGSNEWLVVDLEALSRLPTAERAFLLGEGLGHLHCGHGALFLAHLVGHRRGGHGLLRRLLKPWIRVATFSADRAGLLACGDLEAARLAVGRSAAQAPGWAPRFADAESRRLALDEFASTTVAARFRARQLREGEEINLSEELEALASPPPEPEPGAAPPESASKAESEAEAAQADARDGVPDDAWTIARCDHRLTTRLRLF